MQAVAPLKAKVLAGHDVHERRIDRLADELPALLAPLRHAQRPAAGGAKGSMV